ncbi:hypothetical protein [Lacibacter sp.]|uniref:hypothetical protein n=1 Tax=Lacibacter sp. TaxID=1915409 RepID=UPI002B4ACC16|nr:hypothetical protein [Lacibacter sp.]HLP39541.1 hypothetical protein [Lacibacter sp.]
MNKKIIILIIIVSGVGLCYYFFTHYPVGTFKYSTLNAKEPTIKISCSESLGTFQEPVYNMDVSVEQNGTVYRKRYKTSDHLIFFSLLRKNDREFLIVNDHWKGYYKCENGTCSDFFNLEDRSYSVNNATNDTLYYYNYRDSLKTDTICYIEFKNFKFRKLK